MQRGFDKLSTLLNNHQSNSRLSMQVILIEGLIEIKSVKCIITQSECPNESSLFDSSIEFTCHRVDSVELLSLICVVILIRKLLPHQKQTLVLFNLVAYFVV